MKNSIIFAILIHLLDKTKATRSELAKRFEISPNSAGRYVSVLMDAGIPIYSNRGPGGGYCIDESYRLSDSFITIEEKERLLSLLEASKHSYNDYLTDIVINKVKNIGKVKKSSDESNIELQPEFDSVVLHIIRGWLGTDISRNGNKYYIIGPAPASEAVGKLLSLGRHVKVLSPIFVRDAILLECRTVLAAYNA